jgi:hypothetical protein
VPDSPCGCSMPMCTIAFQRSDTPVVQERERQLVDLLDERMKDGICDAVLETVIALSKTRRLVAALERVATISTAIRGGITGVPSRLEGLSSAPPSQKSLGASSCMPANASSSSLS